MAEIPTLDACQTELQECCCLPAGTLISLTSMSAWYCSLLFMSHTTILSKLSKLSLHKTYLSSMASCDVHCAFAWKHDFSTMCCTGQHFKTAIKYSALCMLCPRPKWVDLCPWQQIWGPVFQAVLQHLTFEMTICMDSGAGAEARRAAAAVTATAR